MEPVALVRKGLKLGSRGAIRMGGGSRKRVGLFSRIEGPPCGPDLTKPLFAQDCLRQPQPRYGAPRPVSPTRRTNSFLFRDGSPGRFRDSAGKYRWPCPCCARGMAYRAVGSPLGTAVLAPLTRSRAEHVARASPPPAGCRGCAAKHTSVPAGREARSARPISRNCRSPR